MNVNQRAVAAAAIGIVVGLGASAPALAQEDGDNIEVRGWLEHARLVPTGLLLDAKLDSGARTSSLDAEILRGPDEDDEDFDDDDIDHTDIEEEEEDEERDEDEEVDADEAEEEERRATHPEDNDGRDTMERGDYGTIIFRVTNETGRTRTLQREIVRYAEIKSRSGGTIRRPVVNLGFCIAGVYVEGEVNLADREDFNYPLLVGRNMLAQAGIAIDSREIYTHRSSCDVPESAG